MVEVFVKVFFNDVEWIIGYRMIFLKVNRLFLMVDLYVVMVGFKF